MEASKNNINKKSQEYYRDLLEYKIFRNCSEYTKFVPEMFSIFPPSYIQANNNLQQRIESKTATNNDWQYKAKISSFFTTGLLHSSGIRIQLASVNVIDINMKPFNVAIDQKTSDLVPSASPLNSGTFSNSFSAF